LSTKIHALVDALGNPLGFHLTPGQSCDLDGADVLLNALAADTVLADKGYDADERVIERLQQQGKTAVIPSKRNRTTPRDYDKDLYKARHLIENFFATLKLFNNYFWEFLDLECRLMIHVLCCQKRCPFNFLDHELVLYTSLPNMLTLPIKNLAITNSSSIALRVR